MRTDDLSIEAKVTRAKQFTLKQDDLLKGEKYALADGKDFVFIVSFGGQEWAIQREADFAHQRECTRLYEGGTP